MNIGALTKLTIRAFQDKKLTIPIDDVTHREFIVPLNPESYSQNFKVEYDTKKGQGNERTAPKYKSTNNPEVKFEFLFDGTNTIEGYLYNGTSVRQQIDAFLETCYRLNGSNHRPNFLKLTWGVDFTFDCILTSLDINYTLFHASGAPLRAKVSATFLNYIEAERRAMEEGKESPDLSTVQRLSVVGSLPYSCYKVYGDANLHLQVAKANNLTSFRNIDTRNPLLFPPINPAL